MLSRSTAEGTEHAEGEVIAQRGGGAERESSFLLCVTASQREKDWGGLVEMKHRDGAGAAIAVLGMRESALLRNA